MIRDEEMLGIPVIDDNTLSAITQRTKVREQGIHAVRLSSESSPPQYGNTADPSPAKLTFNVLCNTIPHKLCRSELKNNYARVTLLRLDTF